jgi:quinol monooxygenase YgiN
MIIVTGSVIANAGKFEALLAVSVEHVQRSRQEPGCISHGVSRDSENPNRLVFFEEWVDRAALRDHFALPASRNFVRAARQLASEPPTITIYDATAVTGDLLLK